MSPALLATESYRSQGIMEYIKREIFDHLGRSQRKFPRSRAATFASFSTSFFILSQFLKKTLNTYCNK